MQVRRACPGDESLWIDAVVALVPEDDREGEILSAEEAAGALRDDRCYLYLALIDDRPVGLLSAYRLPNVEAGGQFAYLYDIEVDKAVRRQGIGSAMVDALLASCRNDRIELVWAGTQVENTAARRTFQSTGAELEGDSYAEYEWSLED